MTSEDLRRALEEARGRLLAAISGVTEEQFKRRPPGETWSIAEVLSHLLQTERLWCGRARLALERDSASIEPSAPEAHEEGARAGRSAPVPQLIHGLLATRRDAEMLIDRAAGMTENGLHRSAWHPRLGQDLTVEWMIAEKLVAHEEEHAAQIEALRPVVGASTIATGEPREA